MTGANQARMDLPTAISHIRQVCVEAERQREQPPFVFLVGAGISVPSVPASGGIKQACKEIAAVYDRTDEPADLSPMDAYSFWFYQALPQPEQRRRFLEKNIKGKEITSANLHLVRLLLDGRVSRLVLTPNFDDFIARALHLFGETFIQCDRLDTADRIDAARSDIQIVHVHGTYQFYDCRNLMAEMTSLTSVESSRQALMSALLDHVFRRRSPLVVGYAGWDQDVIMTALRRRLELPLGHNIYWFCYTQEDAKHLPDWLKDHPNVCLVVPDAPLPGTSDNKLEAVTVFQSLIGAIDLPSLPLARDPFRFFACNLRSAVHNVQLRTQHDLYSIENVIGLLKSARQHQLEHPDALLSREKVVEPGSIDQVLGALRTVEREMMEAQSSEEGMDLQQLANLQQRAQHATGAVAANPIGAELADVYTIASTLYLRYRHTLTERYKSVSQETEAWGTEMLWRAGVALREVGRYAEAFDRFGDIVRLFRFSEFSLLGQWTARALVDSADLLAGKGSVLVDERDTLLPATLHVNSNSTPNSDDLAIAVYEEVVKRYIESSDLMVQVQVAKARIGKAIVLHKLERDGALSACNEVALSYSNAPYPQLRAEAARAFVQQGMMLQDLERFQEAIEAADKAVEVADKVVHDYDDSSHFALQIGIAEALLNKGKALGKLRKYRAEVQVYGRVRRLYGDSSNSSLQALVARAMIGSGSVLYGQFNKPKAALTAYDEIVRRYGNSSEPTVQVQVAEALIHRGGVLENLSGVEGVLKGLLIQALDCYQAVVNHYRDVVGHPDLQAQAGLASDRSETLLVRIENIKGLITA